MKTLNTTHRTGIACALAVLSCLSISCVAAAYQQYHPQGLEILGISLDQANAAAKLAAFTKENNMPWPQVYDGKYWRAALAVQYGVESIPQPILVDGDTGIILAEG